MADDDSHGSGEASRAIDATGQPVMGGDFSVEALWQAFGHMPEKETADPLLGRSLGDVTLIRFIAEGGMGRVYEAEQFNPTRRVAVKVMRPGLFTRDTIRRFVREVSTLGSLRHPWITQVFFAGTYEVAGAELPYFVMELIPEALPITEYVASRHLSVEERLRLFRKVCDAIAYGHERGLVHRDLKPSNLLVDGLGHPKVIDFGVARGPSAGKPVTALTEVGQVIGTLQYMSPEQLSGQSGDVDARADVYSLGVVLYEVLAGQPPYLVRGLPLAQAARVIYETRPKPLRSIIPALPREVAAIVQTCLAKDRETRFRTAGELLAALRDTGTASSWRRYLAAETRRLCRSLCRPFTVGSTTAALILGGLYVMPQFTWSVVVRPAQVESGSQVAFRHSQRTTPVQSPPVDTFGELQTSASFPKEARLTLRHQLEEPSLCSVTCASIVLDYFGSQVSPRVLKVMSRGRDHNPNEPFTDFTGTMFKDVCGAVGKLGFTWNRQHFTNDLSGFEVGLQRVRQSLDAGNPVLVDLTNAFGQVGSHVFVVCGYSDKAGEVFILDVHAKAPGMRKMMYEDLMTAWNSLGIPGRPFNGRGMVLTSPQGEREYSQQPDKAARDAE